MAIITELNITVSGNKASLSSPVYFYLEDGQCTLAISIHKVNAKIGTYNRATNLIEEFETAWARLCIVKPNKDLVHVDDCLVDNGVLLFVVDKSIMDQIDEAGIHAFQIHLYDTIGSERNRFTIPPVNFEVLIPLCHPAYSNPEQPGVEERSLVISPVLETLHPGDIVDLEYTSVPKNSEIIWNSSNNRIASVSKGRVTVHSLGKFKIFGRIQGTIIRDNIELTSKEKFEILTSPDELANLKTGDYARIVFDKKPDNINIRWYVSNENVAVFHEVNGNEAVFLIKGTGNTTITGQVEGTDVSASISIVVEEKFEFITSPDEIGYIPLGEYMRLQFDKKPVKSDVVWTISNEDIVSLHEVSDNEATFLVKAHGSVKITGLIEGTNTSDSIDIHLPSQKIEIRDVYEEAAIGRRLKIYVDKTPETALVEWTFSEDSKAVLVDSGQDYGEVRFLREGPVTITASIYDGKHRVSDSITLDVKNYDGYKQVEGVIKFKTKGPSFNAWIAMDFYDIDSNDNSELLTAYIMENDCSFSNGIWTYSYSFFGKLVHIDFSAVSDMTEIVQIDNVNELTDMSYMFYGCESLTTIPGISDWDVSKVTSMDNMFCRCYKLILPDLSKWNTSNVTDMKHMFGFCESLTTLNLSGWNTGNVTSMENMFGGCDLLTTISGISDWNVSKVTSMEHMFAHCPLLTTFDLSKWNTGNVTNMESMFESCDSLKSIPNLNTSNVTNMNRMFMWCDQLTGDVDAAKFWNNPKVTQHYMTFASCFNLNNYDEIPDSWK